VGRRERAAIERNEPGIPGERVFAELDAKLDAIDATRVTEACEAPCLGPDAQAELDSAALRCERDGPGVGRTFRAAVARSRRAGIAPPGPLEVPASGI